VKATTRLSGLRPERNLEFSGVPSEKLAGLAEVAEILAVPKRTAARYVRREGFPAPLERLASGPVWLRREVREWGRKQLPLRTGRPPKQKGEDRGKSPRKT
jgi:hypothetical protein